MPLDGEHELSPAAIEALQGLIAAPAAPAASEDDLVAFVTGTLPEADRPRVVAALVRSADLRNELVTLHKQLEELSTVPLSEVQTKDASNPRLVSAIIDSAHRSFGFYSHARDKLAKGAWQYVLDGSREAQALISSIGSSLQNVMSAPRFATARGAESGRLHIVNFPSEVEGALEVRIEADSALVANAVFKENSAALEAQELSLEMLDIAGGSVTLGSAPVVNATWRLRCEAFGSIAKLPPGQLPSESFQLSVGSAPKIERPRNHLFAEIEGESPIPLELAEEPRIENHQLVVSLSAPKSVRERLTAYRIEFLIPMHNRLQLIGSAPASGWVQDVFTIRLPLDGVPDGKLDCGSVLHARLMKL